MKRINTMFKFNLPVSETMCFEDEYDLKLKLSPRNKLSLKNQGAEFIYLLCAETGELIGETYFISVDQLKERIKGLSKWKNRNAVYVYGTTILSKFQGKGYGKEIKQYFLNEMKNNYSYRYILGHAKQGSSWEINKKFGASEIKVETNWQKSGMSFYFYKIEVGGHSL